MLNVNLEARRRLRSMPVRERRMMRRVADALPNISEIPTPIKTIAQALDLVKPMVMPKSVAIGPDVVTRRSTSLSVAEKIISKRGDLRALREALGYTQDDVSKLTKRNGQPGVSPAGFGFIELGFTQNPRINTCLAIADALNISLDHLTILLNNRKK